MKQPSVKDSWAAVIQDICQSSQDSGLASFYPPTYQSL